MKDKIKNYLRRKAYSNGLERFMFKPLYAIFCTLRFVFENSYRNRVWMSIFYKEKYHQLSIFTSKNRYPALFNLVKLYAENLNRPIKILSFGCSTGEEIESILEILPNAEIMGVDINPYCIKKANEKFRNNTNVSIINALSDEFVNQNNFDVILALAVFQHPDNRHKNLQVSVYPFEKFDKQVTILNDKLKPKGLFIIDNTDFNFMEASVFGQYRIYPKSEISKRKLRPLFNKNNQRISEIGAIFKVFVKNC